jgi:putative ATPase
VPLHIRNAPTTLMKDLGYGKDYVYPHDAPGAPPQEFLPAELRGRHFYEPAGNGFERDLKARLEDFRRRKENR